jgi:hypothetical protein
VVRGSVYWVSPTGSDENPGTEQQPFATLVHGISVLAPRDGLLVMPGTYEESITFFPPGISWDEPVTVSAWPRRGATLRSPVPEARPLEFNQPTRFVSVEGFVIDGAGGVHEPVKMYQDNIRLRDCDISGSPVAAVSLSAYPDDGGYAQLIDLDIHDNGTTLLEEPSGSPAGGIIASTGNNLFERCRVHDNIGVGLMVYNSPGQGGDGNVIRNNVVSGGTRDDAAGIFLSSGAGSVAYNNIVHQVSGPGIRLDYGAVDCRVLHNTVYAAGDRALVVGTKASDTLARNNIFAGVDGAEGTLSDVSELGVTTMTSNVFVDPLFVDVAAGNFRVQAGSAAIDQGTTEPEVTVDFDGTPRPRGAGYDVGAFER